MNGATNTIRWLALLALFISATSVTAEETGPVFELRTYTTVDGRLPALHARFRDHTMRLFEKHGITNVGYWIPVDAPNTLVYLLRHESMDAARASWRSFGRDPEWRKVARESQADGPILVEGGIKRQFLSATDYSPSTSSSH